MVYIRHRRDRRGVVPGFYDVVLSKREKQILKRKKRVIPHVTGKSNAENIASSVKRLVRKRLKKRRWKHA